MPLVDVLVAAPFYQLRGSAEGNARLWLAHLRGIDEAHVANLALLLASSEVTVDERWYLHWDGRFSQWQRSNIDGSRIETLFRALFRVFRSGRRIRELFDNNAEPGLAVLPSELLFTWIENLSVTLTPTQIEALFTRLRATIGMSKPQVRRFITGLLSRPSALTGTQLDAVSAAILGAKNAIHGTTAEDCTVLGEQVAASAVTNGNVNAFFTVANAPLTTNQAIEIAIEVGFTWTYTLVTTGAAAVNTAVTACNASLTNLIAVLREAKTPRVQHNEAAAPGMTPAECLAFLPFLTNMPGGVGSAHTKMVAFINKAAKAKRDARVDGRSWTAIATLVQHFITQGRRNPPVLANNVSTRLDVGPDRVQVTNERLQYFVRAHTYANCDFTITDRTKDVISFWNSKTVAQMATEVESIEGEMTELVNSARGGNAMTLALVGEYDVGIVHNGGTNFSMLHFHPLPTHGGMTAVHSRLVAAIGELF